MLESFRSLRKFSGCVPRLYPSQRNTLTTKRTKVTKKYCSFLAVKSISSFVLFASFVVKCFFYLDFFLVAAPPLWALRGESNGQLSPTRVPGNRPELGSLKSD
jgi:hypothetical protein